MKRLALFILKLYQKFFTLFSYGSCRYYPTCSEYARLHVVHNNSLIKASFYSFLRILRCNQFFAGGIDYPVVAKTFHISITTTNQPNFNNIKFWFVPKKNKDFYIVKVFNN